VITIDRNTHGSRFDERDAPFAERAAALMGFHVIRIARDAELHSIAEQLCKRRRENPSLKRPGSPVAPE